MVRRGRTGSKIRRRPSVVISNSVSGSMSRSSRIGFSIMIPRGGGEGVPKEAMGRGSATERDLWPRPEEGRSKHQGLGCRAYEWRVMISLTRITTDPNVMGGKPCVRGLRVTVGAIVGLGDRQGARGGSGPLSLPQGRRPPGGAGVRRVARRFELERSCSGSEPRGRSQPPRGKS